MITLGFPHPFNKEFSIIWQYKSVSDAEIINF